jgi:hypothetical protein
MKKILVFSLILVLISAAASAQVRVRVTSPNIRPHVRLNSNQLTFGEKKELRKDAVRYRMIKRRVGRDGVVTPIERRKLRKAKCETRRDLVRFKHNGRRRIM